MIINGSQYIEYIYFVEFYVTYNKMQNQNQVGIFNKVDIGFDQTQKTKMYESFFVSKRK